MCKSGTTKASRMVISCSRFWAALLQGEQLYSLGHSIFILSHKLEFFIKIFCQFVLIFKALSDGLFNTLGSTLQHFLDAVKRRILDIGVDRGTPDSAIELGLRINVDKQHIVLTRVSKWQPCLLCDTLASLEAFVAAAVFNPEVTTGM